MSPADDSHDPARTIHKGAACADCEYGGLAVGEALHRATRVLAANGIDSPRLDAEVLLAHVLGVGRTGLYGRWTEPLDEQSARRLADLICRRAAHEPVAYLLGRRFFYDLDLYVDLRVLIPRPETEHLLEDALGWAKAWAETHKGRSLRVADVGTGSGALAIALARHLANTHVWAIDCSADALQVASLNVAQYGLQERITPVQSDLMSACPGRFDLIVANLPYVPREDWPTLPSDVAAYEPRAALDGGQGGLDIIRRLLAQAPEHLASPGLLLLEIDPRQADAVLGIAHAWLPDAQGSILYDYAGLARVVRVERQTVDG